MTKRKSGTQAPAQSRAEGSWDRWAETADEYGIVVREEDRAEFVLMILRALDLGLPPQRAVDAFKGARAAMAGVLVGKQRPAGYLDDRRRGFAAARHACLVPEGA